MQIIIKSIHSKNYIVTIAHGEDYIKDLKNCSLPTWIKYCKKNDIGIIVFNKPLIDKSSKNWKKANWQKLLIGDILGKSEVEIENVCFLDVDILINHYAPNIFDFYDSNTFGLVSQFFNTPFPIYQTQKRIAFNRHFFYDIKYPLDSALFMGPKEIFKSMGLSEFDNYACTGLIMFNIKNHSQLMKSWFHKYPSDIKSLTGGEEPHLNWEIQNHGKITWLDYKFQAIWIFEQAWNYPFLYTDCKKNKKIIKLCIESSISNNYFLHFAGSWYESDMWKIKSIYKSDSIINRIEKFQSYLAKKPKALPVGQIKPT